MGDRTPPDPTLPLRVPPHAAGLELWLVRHSEQESAQAEETLQRLASLAPARVLASGEVEAARRLARESGAELVIGDPGTLAAIFERALERARGRTLGTPWVVLASDAQARELVAALLGLAQRGAAVLCLDPGHAHLLRADPRGWTLERSNVLDPRLRRAADLEDGAAD